jgi:hypothetical protein
MPVRIPKNGQMKKTETAILYRCARFGDVRGIRVCRDASGYERRKVDTICGTSVSTEAKGRVRRRIGGWAVEQAYLDLGYPHA